MLEIRDLTVAYGGIVAVRNVSFSVSEGQMVAIIGPNGAGKSSLLNAISGVVKSFAGSIQLDGAELRNASPHRVSRGGVLQVPEGRQIFGPLTVEDNLELGARAAVGRSRGDRLKFVYELFPILHTKREQLGQSLSGGQQQMLAIGRALMGWPKVLLLDEPSLGLSPLMSDEVFKALEVLKQAGLTMVVVEQNAQRALEACQFTYVLEGGRIVRAGASAELLASKDIAEHYLGLV